VSGNNTIVTVAATVIIPTIPNHLRMENGLTMPLCAASEEGLREIGARWTEKLIERAREQRQAETEAT